METIREALNCCFPSQPGLDRPTCMSQREITSNHLSGFVGPLESLKVHVPFAILWLSLIFVFVICLETLIWFTVNSCPHIQSKFFFFIILSLTSYWLPKHNTPINPFASSTSTSLNEAGIANWLIHYFPQIPRNQLKAEAGCLSWNRLQFNPVFWITFNSNPHPWQY